MEEQINIPIVTPSDLTPILWWINATSYNNSSDVDGDDLNSTEWEIGINNNDTASVLLVMANKNWTIGNSFILFNLRAIKWLNFYYLCAIMIVGVLGNGFNFIAFLRTRRKLSSPSYYLATLALADAVFLAIIFIVWISHFKIKLFFWSGLYKILVYLSSLSSCMSRKFISIYLDLCIDIIRCLVLRINSQH
jgi:hypothetical protein